MRSKPPRSCACANRRMKSPSKTVGVGVMISDCKRCEIMPKRSIGIETSFLGDRRRFAVRRRVSGGGGGVQDRFAGHRQDRVVLRRVDPTTQDVSVVPLQWVAAAEAGIPD